VTRNDQVFEIRTPNGAYLCCVTGTLRTAVLAIYERLGHALAVLRAHSSDDPEDPLVTGYFDHEGTRLIQRYLYSSSGVEFENWEDAENRAHGWLPGEHWKIGAQFMPLSPPGSIVGRAVLQVDPCALPALDVARESGIRRAHYYGFTVDVIPIKLAEYPYSTANFVVRSGNGKESALVPIHAMYENLQQAMEAALSQAEGMIDSGAFSNPIPEALRDAIPDNSAV
jgi:hypothetical protein